MVWKWFHSDAAIGQLMRLATERLTGTRATLIGLLEQTASKLLLDPVFSSYARVRSSQGLGDLCPCFMLTRSSCTLNDTPPPTPAVCVCVQKYMCVYI